MEIRGTHGPGARRVLTSLFGTAGLETLDVYRAHGGYGALEKALQMDRSAAARVGPGLIRPAQR